jgi:hypothetical protein
MQMPAKIAQKCVACGKPIRGKPALMRLQITHEQKKLMERAKELGFSSASWRAGDRMEGLFHENCFNVAKLIWQVAFNTRALSPRR